MNGSHFSLNKKVSTVEKFQNTALQLFALTASMNANRSYGYFTSSFMGRS